MILDPFDYICVKSVVESRSSNIRYNPYLVNIRSDLGQEKRQTFWQI